MLYLCAPSVFDTLTELPLQLPYFTLSQVCNKCVYIYMYIFICI